MLSASSEPREEFDSFLLSIEELFRQRMPKEAIAELSGIRPEIFCDDPANKGLYYSLCAEARYFEGKYGDGVVDGSTALALLAPSAYNRQVGQTLLTLSKCHSGLGELTQAESRARDAISAFRRTTYRTGVINGLNELARVSFIRCDYPLTSQFLTDALSLSEGSSDSDPVRVRQLRGNLGRVQISTGHWAEAEKELNDALKYDLENSEEISAARNYLSIGYLKCRQRRFHDASQMFDKAERLISKHKLNRERLILEEYRGELVFDKGDYLKARTILSKALTEAREMAPESALVTQIGRRLAEIHFALDDLDHALILAQRSLVWSKKLGEMVEVGLCSVLVGRLFARMKTEKDSAKEAIEYYEDGLEILRRVGDPLELGRSLLFAPKIYSAAKSEVAPRLLVEAQRCLRSLNCEFYSAIALMETARYALSVGDLEEGYQPLCEARRIFSGMKDQAREREIASLLRQFATQAVAFSVSSDNSFNVFSHLISESDYTSFRSGGLTQTLQVLRSKTGADRVFAMSVGNDQDILVSSGEVDDSEKERFRVQFESLLGAEFLVNTPTLLLDVGHDPYINKLLADGNDTTISCVIVTPLRSAEKVIGYVVLTRLRPSRDKFSMRLPFSQDELNFTVGFSDFVALKMTQALNERLTEDNSRLKAQVQEKTGFSNIITRNPEMIELLQRVQQVINSDISITLTGETGCGKDLLAKAIHYNSNRKDKRFISVNCAALPEALLESELFGHKRGSFTGADRDKPGLFEEADGGTFFMDEIGDMPLSVQAKLLRVLEEKEIVRLGESVPRKVDVRVISATNKDLSQLIEEKLFRPDLYYRLSPVMFRIPPMRERRDDIPALIKHFKGESEVTFTAEAMRLLIAYDWPGNVREIENEVKKLCLICGENKIVDTDLLTPKISGRSDASFNGINGAKGTNGSNGAAALEVDEIMQSSGDGFSLYDFLAEHEIRFITRALRDSAGVKKHAAALLKIPESTLRLKIKQYAIDPKGLILSESSND